MWRDGDGDRRRLRINPPESPPPPSSPSNSTEWDDPPSSSTADSPISDLPEHLIHRIISSLPPEYPAAQLSILSKRFLSAWNSIPCLSFDDSHCGSAEKTAMFLPYITSTLARRRPKLPKLRIKFTSGSGAVPNSQINSAIDSAFEIVTQALDLDFGRCNHPLRRRIFSSAASLTSLRLTGFDLSDLASSEGDLTISYPLLEDLMLCRCSGICDLRVSSPRLKSLEIDDCEGLESLDLQALNNLESIRLRRLKFRERLMDVAIASGGVRSLDLQFDAPGKCFANFVPLPRRILSMQSLSALRLSNFSTAADVLTFNYPLLEDLELCKFRGFEALNISCPKLRSLGIVSCPDLKSLDLDAQTSKLRSIRLIGFTPRNNLLEISQENLQAAELDIVSRSAVGITMFRCPKLESLDIKYKEELHSGEIDLSGCQSLRSLKLTRAGITSEWIKKNVSIMAKLERLELDGCLCLESLIVHHKKLESLALKRCHNLSKIEVDAIELNNFHCYFSSLELQELALRSSDKLLAGFFMADEMFNAACFDRSMRILQSLGFSKKLKLMASLLKTLTIPKSLRDQRLTLYAIVDMEVELFQRPELVKSGEIVHLVDSLLWLAPRLRVVLLVFVDKFADKLKKTKVTKSLNFRYLKEEVQWLSCCQPESRLKCWRHSLSGVTMTGFEPREKMELAEFFRSNAVTYVDDDDDSMG